jgi:putative transposase
MPTILKAYKYRVYPDKVQAEFLDRNFGAVRFLWNQFVSSFNSYNVGPVLPENEKILKDRHPWMHDVISYALQQKRMDWFEFKKQFFNKKRKVKLGRPSYKKRGVSNDSFRLPGACIGFNAGVNFAKGTIKLPKMTPLKVIYDRRFSGQLRSVTLSKNKCNQYFVSILVEETIEVKPGTGRSIGIDLGLKHLCILSNGMKIDNPRWFRETQAKLKRAQQHLSRKTKGSNRRERQRLKVAKLHLKVANQRRDFQHNFSSWLVNNYDTIITEDLNVKGMVKNRKLAKSISDASWSTLVGMIAYKSNWYGRSFHKIDRWYPSSKTCSSCGHKENNMGLHVRDWKCPSCGVEHDRDLNAALNILHKGLDDLYGFKTSEELSDYRRGEGLRPEVVMPKAPSLNRLVSLVSFIEFDRTT